MQKIVDADRHEYVQFEIPLRGGHSDGDVVRDDLHGDHGHGFALRRIDFPGHDGAARLVGRDIYFPEAVARAAREPADVVRDLHQVGGERFQSSVREHEVVFGGQRVKFVFRGNKLLARELSNDFRGLGVEAGRCVDPGADGRSSDGKLFQTGE